MEPRSGGLAASLRNFAASAAGIAQTRLELLSVEVQEEALRIESLLAYGAAAFLLIGFGTFFAAAFLTVVFWETHRLAALGIATAVFLAGGVVCLIAMRSFARRGSRLFASSLAELARDRETLGE
ncbi:MAG TPA: hypothetical protein DHV08_00090 [Rhodocyclaceae bacterium]|nr:MAG: hypothetical protein AUK49_05810 [Betaproteobacteria bacterium CG2_30_68_42]PIV72466.1 MAG: hypothetical protein COW56_08955 [Rhodocyclales bacterium CG17_big_fil_post_rev_8_21_14_2_50_68_7]PJA56613.1 MAG: hypothetical protein CO164_12240 [Rhodocyclales bacterium CG_4_9_14_3_um_filter_68_10]HCX32092.1 hypothetical protein [Rhodocyclaceae bacterium]